MDFKALSCVAPMEPQFIMAGIPAGYATGLYGHGGVGKSHIALQLAACISLGIPFCGLPVERRKVLFLACEDRAPVIHARLAHICRHLKVNLEALSGWLEVLDLVGHDTVLYTADGPTSTLNNLREAIANGTREIVFVDGLADVFGGNENARTDAKRFLNMLVGLIDPVRGAVVVVGHIDKASARTDSRREIYSGSTGWWNGFRSVVVLYPETRGDERTGNLILEMQKANLGQRGLQISFAWDEAAHLFVGGLISAITPSEKAKQEHEERRALLDALRSCKSKGIVVPAAATGCRTAFHVLSEHPLFPHQMKNGASGKRRFWRAVEVLRQAGQVLEATHVKPNRHSIMQLVASEEAETPRKF